MLVPAGPLQDLVKRVFVALGTPDDIAAEEARHLVDSDLTGHGSHGVLRFSYYVNDIREGKILAAARPKIVKESRGVALVNGEWGFGHYVTDWAMDEAIRLAKEYGVAAVGIVRCNHNGRLGYFTDKAVSQGVVAQLWSGGHSAAGVRSVPYGGRVPAYGANPFAMGFPADGGTFTLDYATTMCAGGTVVEASYAGKSMPEGYLLDREGRPTTNPKEYMDGGFLLPFGGYKGSALAVFTELAARVLTGSGYFADEPAGQTLHKRSGALILALDASVFRPLTDVAADAGQLLRGIEQSPPAAGFDRVRTAGMPEREARAARIIQGIPLADTIWADVVDQARSVGISDSDIGAVAAVPATAERVAPWWDSQLLRSLGNKTPASRAPADANDETRR